MSLASWADFVADLVATARDPVALVGHSRGAVVVSEAAERMPARVHVLVYLTAFLVPTASRSPNIVTDDF